LPLVPQRHDLLGHQQKYEYTGKNDRSHVRHLRVSH
jgi:hypothetical protein